jgi:hypothetical protein
MFDATCLALVGCVGGVDRASGGVVQATIGSTASKQTDSEAEAEAKGVSSSAQTGLEDEYVAFHDMSLEEVLREKNSPVLWTIETDTIFETIKKMDENKVGMQTSVSVRWCVWSWAVRSSPNTCT